MDFGFPLPLGEFRYAGRRLGAFGDTVVGDDRDRRQNRDDHDDDQEFDDGEGGLGVFMVARAISGFSLRLRL